MTRKRWILLIVAAAIAMSLGCTVSGLTGLAPQATPTPTKTLIPTFTATPTIVPSPTDTATPTMPPETPTSTETATPTAGPPTNTPTPRPPAPTSTPKPPAPTNTPQPAYDYELVQEPIRDPCHPGVACLPEVAGTVVDAQGNPIDNFNRVWVKLACGLPICPLYCPTGDPAQMLQPGQFKFVSEQLFGEYKLTIVKSEGGPALSPTYDLKMVAWTKGQQWNILFRRKY